MYLNNSVLTITLMKKFHGKFKKCVPKNASSGCSGFNSSSTPQTEVTSSFLLKATMGAEHDDPSKMSIRSCYKIMTA